MMMRINTVTWLLHSKKICTTVLNTLRKQGHASLIVEAIHELPLRLDVLYVTV